MYIQNCTGNSANISLTAKSNPQFGPGRPIYVSFFIYIYMYNYTTITITN